MIVFMRQLILCKSIGKIRFVKLLQESSNTDIFLQDVKDSLLFNEILESRWLWAKAYKRTVVVALGWRQPFFFIRLFIFSLVFELLFCG